jgi:hypothetical protein
MLVYRRRAATRRRMSSVAHHLGSSDHANNNTPTSTNLSSTSWEKRMRRGNPSGLAKPALPPLLYGLDYFPRAVATGPELTRGDIEFFKENGFLVKKRMLEPESLHPIAVSPAPDPLCCLAMRVRHTRSRAGRVNRRTC